MKDGKMAQWVEALAAKADDLSLTPEMHTQWQAQMSQPAVLWNAHVAFIVSYATHAT